MSAYSIWTTVPFIMLSIIRVGAALDCDLYMAESTIPNAGLGIFSAIELNPGDRVGEGDVCIPILNAKNYHKDLWNPFHDYVWGGEIMGMKLEIESADKEAYCPGLDCAINCNLALINVAKSTPIYDNGGLQRHRHPGAGAISPYHNGTTLVTRAIPPGGELFKFYGDAWFTTRSIFNSLPISHDYPWAQEILDEFFKKMDQKGNSFKSTAYEELVVSIRSIWNSRTLNALPNTFNEAVVAFEHQDIGAIHQPSATRSIQWLQENGKCVDNIIPGRSTVDGAGNGGFAKRDLPKGTIITGSPLHHLPLKDGFMPMYKAFHSDANADEKLKSEITGYQLLLNYCFGHSESTLLLCPYGAGVGYINHNQALANVKVVWSEHGKTAHDASWLKKQPHEMFDTKSARLALDYVATRDIAAGEELFLDYGDVWEEAWNEHISSWKPESAAESYLGGRDWNKVMESLPVRTNKEALHDPYPPHVHLRCHVDIVDDDEESEDESDDESEDDSDDESEDEGRDDESKESSSFHWGPSDYGYKCEVTSRKIIDGIERYSVRVTTEPENRWDVDFEGTKLLDIDNVSREAIRFFDKPSTSDLFLKGTFRHFIGLPDHLMPKEWKNVNQNSARMQNPRM